MVSLPAPFDDDNKFSVKQAKRNHTIIVKMLNERHDISMEAQPGGQYSKSGCDVTCYYQLLG